MSNFLHELLSTPTSPFREKWIIECVVNFLKKNKISYFQDPAGNLVVGAKNLKHLKQIARSQSAKNPLKLFVAHMDHPGFHLAQLVDSSESLYRYEFEWFGGAPVEKIEGAKVWISSLENPSQFNGIIESFTKTPSGRSIASGVIVCDQKIIEPKQLFGGFGFSKPMWTEGDLIYTKAADDLIGCYAILQTALKASKNSGFIGLLTRAEEVGFIGAIAHLEWAHKNKLYQKNTLAVSLETSRQLPGAEIGKGPIVRLGDRMHVFSTGPTKILAQLAEQALPGASQKRVMDGGACEASATVSYGLPTIAMSVPLGNYHNQSLEGGPESRHPNGPAPEFVNMKDVDGLLKLCESIVSAKVDWSKPFEKTRKEFVKSWRGYQKRKLI